MCHDTQVMFITTRTRNAVLNERPGGNFLVQEAACAQRSLPIYSNIGVGTLLLVSFRT